MNVRTLAIVVAAIALLGMTDAHAGAGVAPWQATIAHGGAYDITYDDQGQAEYTYEWELTFNGTGTGADNERIRAFALYYLPDSVLPVTDQEAADTITNPVAERGTNTTVSWSWPGDPHPLRGNTVAWSADNPTSDPATSDAVFVSETIASFRTKFSDKLPEEYFTSSDHMIPSGVHVQWTDETGQDQSEWVNQTPEPVSIALLALGLPTALIVRRRRA